MYIKIVGDTSKYQGKLERVGLHLIKVSGLTQHTSGFRLYLDNDVLVGDYSTFVYPYLDPNLGEGIYEYSDNNMDYEEESTTPTKEEQEKQKIEGIVTKLVGDNVNLLANQVTETSETLLSIYEILLDIQGAVVVNTDTTEEETEEVTDDTTTTDVTEENTTDTIETEDTTTTDTKETT